MTDLASPGDNNRLSVDFVPRSEVRGTSSSVVEEGSCVVDEDEIKRRKEAFEARERELEEDPLGVMTRLHDEQALDRAMDQLATFIGSGSKIPGKDRLH